MEVRKYREGRDAMTSLWDKNGERRGIVSRTADRDNPARTTYGVAIDNMGDPYRGVLDRELNTLLGRIDYGYDGDTVGASITPPAVTRENWSAPGVDYSGAYIDNIAGMYPEIYKHRVGNDTNYGAAIEGMPFGGNGWGEINTPVGRLRGGLSDDHVLGAEFTPNQYYIQALANLLRR